MTSDTRTCTKCGETKPATTEHFSPRPARPCGFHSRCKPCQSLASTEYKRLHQEQVREYGRKYHASHLPQFAAWMRAWRIRNPERTLELVRQYDRRNPDAVRARNARHRARKLGNGGNHTAADIQAQDKRQHHTCFWCKERLNGKSHVDHVIPLALGGSNGPENLVIACPHCNCTKQAKHPMEFAGVMC